MIILLVNLTKKKNMFYGFSMKINAVETVHQQFCSCHIKYHFNTKSGKYLKILKLLENPN